MNLIKIHSQLQRAADQRLIAWYSSLPENDSEFKAFISQEFGEDAEFPRIVENQIFKFFCDELDQSQYNESEKLRLFNLGRTFHESIIAQRKLSREAKELNGLD